MIQLTDNLWIGDSDDGYLTGSQKFGAALNVAHDLKGCGVWPEVEYAQVGLVDGPGNEVSGYCAAVLALVSLLKRYEAVLVYDHNGSRALAVAAMYLNLTEGKYRANPLSWSHWLTWEERIDTLEDEFGRPLSVPIPHAAHIEAFAKLPFGVLEALL